MTRQRRVSRHDCEIEIARTIPGRRLRACCIALAKGTSRSTVAQFVREGMPCDPLCVGPSGRAMRRFDLQEVNAWISGRRERQIRGTLDGHRFARRVEGSR